MPDFQKNLRRFGEDESGSMVIMGLYLFASIVLLGGVGLTVIAHEQSRMKLQTTIDAAVLKAADLNQTLDPEEVVIDYFRKAGLLENLKRVEVTEGFNSREVLAEAELTVGTLFLGAIGHNAWNVTSVGAAREDIKNVEVSMVLDTSGSMRHYARIDALKGAAKEFVDDLLLTDTGQIPNGDMSISIVPYSTQVAMPSSVLDGLSLRHRHGNSACVDFEVGDFLTTALPSAERAQTGHFDALTTSRTPYRWTCSVESGHETLLFSQDATTLKAKIDALEPYQQTSTDIGVKWGAAFLDPTARDIVNTMIDNGEIDSDFRDRPRSFGARDQMKILVVMSDGDNTTQHRLVDEYASGDSDAWRHGNQWSVHVPGASEHHASLFRRLSDVRLTWSNGTHGGGITGPQYGGGNGNNGCGVGSGWNNGNYNGGGWNNGGRTNNCGGDDDAWDEDDIVDEEDYADPAVEEPAEDWFIVQTRDWEIEASGGGDAVRQNWQDIWANYSVRGHAHDFRYAQFGDYATRNEWQNKVVETVGGSEKDNRMAAVCDAARQSGILVFAIGFEVTPTNAAKLRDCASSENHYFDVDNDTIDLAFKSIANSINQLRLVQ